LKDEDHIPLEELDEDEFKKNVDMMFKKGSEKDEEAEEAQKEVS
jgi:hypothetical protein